MSSFKPRALTALILSAIFTMLAAMVPVTAEASSPLPAPTPRWYTSSYSGGKTYVRGLSGVSGAAKFQIIKFKANSRPTVVTTVKPGKLASFATVDGVYAARAVSSSGRIGHRSPWIALQDIGGKDEWDTSLEMRKSNVSNFGKAAVKYIKKRAAGCLKDEVFDAAFKALVKKAKKSANLYTTSAGTIAEFYKKLYDSAFDNNCDILKKVVVYSTKMVAAGIKPPVKGKVPFLYVVSTYDGNGPFLPSNCQIYMSSMNGKTGTYVFNTSLDKDECDDVTRQWYY